MFCKYCGKELINGAKFCSQCGKMLTPSATNAAGQEEQAETKETTATVAENKKFCKHCGKEILPTVKFCPKCGNKTNISMDLSESSQSSPANQDALSQDSIQSTTEKEKINEVPQETLRANEKKFCKFCGSKVSESTMFCPKCGKGLTDTVKIVESTPQAQESISPIFSYSSNPIRSDDKNFSAKNLFIQIFKKHTAEERDKILKAGIVNEVSSGSKVSQENLQPWLYSRVFLILLAVFLAFEICLLGFNNWNMMPGIMLIGSLMMPFAILTMYFELNIYKDISFYKAIGIFLLGGAISLLFTLFLYQIIPTSDGFNFSSAALISIIEEIGKAFIVIIILKRTKNAGVLHGLLIGGAVGAGFAVFESAGYAFNEFLDAHDWNTRASVVNDYLPWYSQRRYADDIGYMNFTIFLRSILSFGGHTAWAAIAGAAFAKKNALSPDFFKMFAVCFILHAIWDTNTPATYFKLAILCLVAWRVIIWQISKFVEENLTTESKQER